MAGRVTQLPIEAIILPTSQKVRITQVPIEAIILPTTAITRVTQLSVEVIIGAAAPPTGRIYGPAAGHM